MNPETMALLQAILERQQNQQGQGMQMELDAADAMGPDGVRRLAGLGTMPDRMALGKDVYGQEAGMSQGDMERGAQLQDKRFGNSGSALGNVFGGVGDIFNTIRGGIMENRGRAGMADALKRYREGNSGMLDTQDQTRGDFGQARMDAIRKLLQGQQQPQAPYYLAKP